MTIFGAIFRKPAKARKRLREVTVTNSDGVTRVNADALFREKEFLKNTARLRVIAERMIDKQPA